jgi:2-(1,2-epoxy-1,2-dihydrophenyl)acetyl-CoA isomerase
MSALVLKVRDGPVGLLTLNRPRRHNSLVPALLREILTALEEFRADPQLQVVVLQANGRSFSTGGDLRGFYEHLDTIAAYADEVVGLLNRVIMAMVNLPLPIVSVVHGIATGGSLGLVLASDIVLVAPEASFTPFYSVVGFSPDGGWTTLLPEIIGRKRSAEILMLNSTIAADQAVSWGLANQLIQAEDIRDTALSIAHDIATKQTGSIRQIKKILASHSEDLADRLEAERVCFVEQIKTRETQQSMIAFLEKMGG